MDKLINHINAAVNGSLNDIDKEIAIWKKRDTDAFGLLLKDVDELLVAGGYVTPYKDPIAGLSTTMGWLRAEYSIDGNSMKTCLEVLSYLCNNDIMWFRDGDFYAVEEDQTTSDVISKVEEMVKLSHVSTTQIEKICR